MTSSFGWPCSPTPASCSVVVWYFATNDWMLSGILASNSRGCASWDQYVTAAAGVDRCLNRICVADNHDTAIRRIETIAITLHRMLRRKCRDGDLFVLVETTLVVLLRGRSLWPHQESGAGFRQDFLRVSMSTPYASKMCSVIDRIPGGAVYFQLIVRPDVHPVRIRLIASRVIGMEVGHKGHLQIAGFDCRNLSVESSGLCSAHNAWSKINKGKRDRQQR